MNKREREKAQTARTNAREWANEQAKGGEASCVQLPEGMEAYKLATGTHKVDIMPFRAGDHNPRADKGMEHYERTYVLHWIPSTTGKNMPVACRMACFDKRCAVCDWLRENGGHADPDTVKNMRAKTRHIWLVNDKPGQKKNALKVMDTTDKNRGMGFAELMADAINTLDESITAPFTLVGGHTAVITVKEQTMGDGKKYNAATRIDLRPRDYDYPEDMLDDNPCLDDCIMDPGYDEVMRMIEPGKYADEDDDRLARAGKPSGNGRHHNDDDDDDDGNAASEFEAGEEVTYDGDTYTIKRVAKDGTLVLEDEEGEVTRDVDPGEVSKEEARKPAGKKPGGKPKPKDDDEDDDEGDSDLEPDEDEDDDEEDSELEPDDEDEEEEKPAPKKAGKKPGRR